ncbi:helix-turn-helix transcriptional regulator [Cellulomonas sp. JH27-2]|uniref:ArsR/SmtB family transcription factor n=1 Tax=Cellulomonas sp. JH27-2 TaxID=2774139 RepID=UPI0017806E12|nr:DUF5937 family protein [Cellulomonas sp. JH27-2]MBD8058289.1 helix-turn-helix transcriptional regulator [Cellulomonas sp. JH27-2]
MLRYELTDADVGGVRFGISPLCELGLSLRAVHDPSRFPLQLPWLRRTEPARQRLDMRTLLALVDDRQWTPDFLNPSPASPLTRIDDELAALAGTPDDVVEHDLVAVHGSIPAALGRTPAEALARIVAALHEMWDLCFEPYWPRIRAVLEADIAFRGRVLAQSGLSRMLNELAPTVSFDGRAVSMTTCDPRPRSYATDGAGLTLVPTMFTRRASAPVSFGPPMILYSARGQGALWETEDVSDPAAVTAVLGAVRARLLVALAEPASSTELAVRFDVTTSAVNQHLRVLRDAGLVTSSRYGRSVLYLRSDLGSALLAGAA